jgi:glycosyltransferase involved in cell wall biosynthesis
VRILYFADIRFPLERANGIQTFETCRALAARGHQVRLVVRPDSHRPARDPWTFYGASPDPRLQIDVTAKWPDRLRRAAYLGAVSWRLLTRRGDVLLTRDLGVASLATRLPRWLRPPIVYEAHGYAPAVSEELPRLLGPKTAAPSPAKLARLAAREARVWRIAEGYVTLTEAHRDELTKRFGERANVAVVPDGARLAPGRTWTPAPDGPELRIGYAGHLYPWKGVDVLIEAVADLPGCRAVVIGGQPGELDCARLEALARSLGALDRVEFRGWQPPRDVAAQLAECQVLVLPNTRSTISERYTSPLKLFEYLAAGRPIVASNLPALREVLRDGVNALLVEPGQPEALKRSLAQLADNEALRRALGTQAFADAAAYSWDARAERLERILTTARGRM